MKLLTLLLTLLLTGHAIAATLTIKGFYFGKNPMLQNPPDLDGFGFCAFKISVNGRVLPGGLGNSVVEIDFSLFNIHINQPVTILIDHGANCVPRLLNPEVLYPKSTYKLKEINASPTGEISWSTIDEDGKSPFIIEQYKWEKWVEVGQEQGKGKSVSINSYQFKIVPHSGKNIVRVSQIDHTGSKRPSKEVRFNSNLKEMEKKPAKVKLELSFFSDERPCETQYQIYDLNGSLVKKGFGLVINCSFLAKGAYYINFDNKTEKFFKI
jgi:hypothetical protein